MAIVLPASLSTLWRKHLYSLSFAFRPNETQFNSFLFNACLRNAVCVAVVLIGVLNIPGYTEGSEIFLLMAKVNGAASFYKIAGVIFFIYIMLLVSAFTIIGLIIIGSDRIRYGDEIQKNNEKQKSVEEKLVSDESDWPVNIFIIILELKWKCRLKTMCLSKLVNFLITLDSACCLKNLFLLAQSITSQWDKS